MQGGASGLSAGSRCRFKFETVFSIRPALPQHSAPDGTDLVHSKCQSFGRNLAYSDAKYVAIGEPFCRPHIGCLETGRRGSFFISPFDEVEPVENADSLDVVRDLLMFLRESAPSVRGGAMFEWCYRLRDLKHCGLGRHFAALKSLTIRRSLRRKLRKSVIAVYATGSLEVKANARISSRIRGIGTLKH